MALSPEVLTAVLTEVAEQVAILQTELVESAMPLVDEDTLDHLYRASHTMKGLAGAVEMRELHLLANAMDLVFSQSRSGALCIDSHTGAILRDASVVCAQLAGGEISADADLTGIDVAGVIARLEAIESSAAPTRRVLFHTTSAPIYSKPSAPPSTPTDES